MLSPKFSFFLTWLENLILEFGYNLRDKRGIRICEEGDRGHQSPAVVVDDILILRDIIQLDESI